MKWMSFVLAAAFCGLVGALNAIRLGIVSIETLFYATSGAVVMMTLLGGMGTFFGPFVGAALFLALEDIASNWTTHWQLVAGLIFIACVRSFRKAYGDRPSQGPSDDREHCPQCRERDAAIREIRRARRRFRGLPFGRVDLHHRAERR